MIVEKAGPATDPPTDKEILVEEDKFKAMCFLTRADDVRFKNLLKQLKDGSFLGRDEYPTTVTDAYDLLVRTSGAFKRSSGSRQHDRGGRGHGRGHMFSQVETETMPGRDGVTHPTVTCFH